MLKIRGISNARSKVEYTVSGLSYKCSPRRLSLQGKEASNERKANDGFSVESMTRQIHIPNNWDKYMLVWAKKYPSIQEVPPEIPQQTMERTRNIVRIRINLIMCGLTILTCFVMALLGRRAAEKGESIAKSNLDWHKQINKDNEK